MNDVLSSIRDFHLILIFLSLNDCHRAEKKNRHKSVSWNRCGEQIISLMGIKKKKDIRSKAYEQSYLLLIECENKLGSVSCTLQEIPFIFQQDNATVLKGYTSLTWQYSTYELMGGDTLTWFRDLLRPLLKTLNVK